MSGHVCMYHLHIESASGTECQTVLGSMDEVAYAVEEGKAMDGRPILSYAIVNHSDDDCDMSECDADPIESAE